MSVGFRLLLTLLKRGKKSVVKILFICWGNICRSPMAEFVLKELVRLNHLDAQFEIASAGVSTEELGNPVYPPARRMLAKHGITCSDKTARQMNRRDYTHYDYLIGMDNLNMRYMRRFYQDDPLHKLCMLLDFTDRPGDVADPWYTDNFAATWKDALEGCEALLKELSQTIPL